MAVVATGFPLSIFGGGGGLPLFMGSSSCAMAAFLGASTCFKPDFLAFNCSARVGVAVAATGFLLSIFGGGGGLPLFMGAASCAVAALLGASTCFKPAFLAFNCSARVGATAVIGRAAGAFVPCFLGAIAPLEACSLIFAISRAAGLLVFFKLACAEFDGDFVPPIDTGAFVDCFTWGSAFP